MVFHGGCYYGDLALRKALRRKKLLIYYANLPTFYDVAELSGVRN